MAPHNDRFLPPSHAQKVRRQKERELELDLDGDGLTVREELKYGLHPYAPDSDGDGIYDGDEVASNTNPRRYNNLKQPLQQRDRLQEYATNCISKKAELRQRYLEHAKRVLGRPQLTYDELASQIASDRWLAQALDSQVLQSAYSANEQDAQYLLSQSPYIQFHAHEADSTPDRLLSYVREVVAATNSNVLKTDEDLYI
ncbi:thrombospondin type 3 repeat-containing protein [Chroococcidiopsis thermalis]|uniref:Uncharacterized protein n=1 Tax=Chroococcidiopsis thermalis (strain PCC 7203) TaxID=251229 RepID=K9U3Z9_CHRTP|nr:thrombospondin type 3 repeat-containing protein [Chroococcidiopsis thermalis]AFY89353.1 hypothetical protein Chro_3944 [Chroococcidiopsis thermalis PCC 7203]